MLTQFLRERRLLRLWALKLHPGSGQYPWIFVRVSYILHNSVGVCAWIPLEEVYSIHQFFIIMEAMGLWPPKIKNNWYRFSFHIYLITAPFSVYSSIARDLRFDASQYLLSPNYLLKTLFGHILRDLNLCGIYFSKLILGYLVCQVRESSCKFKKLRCWRGWPILENLWQGSYTHTNFSACIKYEPHTHALLSRSLLIF